MALRNNSLIYGSIAKTLHWGMAVIIIGLLIIGLSLEGMSPSPDKLKLIGLHKSFGILVLTLAAARLLWKMHNVSPFFPDSMKPWERIAASAGHWLLYFFMFAMPLSGWAMSSAAGYPVSVFGLVTLPNLLPPSQQMRILMGEAHAVMAWGLIAMVALHSLAALLHHVYYKDNVLNRMLPYGRLRKEESYSRSDTMAGC